MKPSQKKSRSRKTGKHPVPFSNRKLLLLFAAIGLIIYLPQLGGGFIFDDGHYVQNNPNLETLRSLLDWPRFWSNRTLYWLSFFMEKQLWGNNPTGFKMVNLGCHILAAFFLVRFLRKLVQLTGHHDNRFPLIAGTLFLVSPLAVEAVSYISGRNNSIGGMFFILGGWLVLKWLDPETEKRKRIAAGAFLSFVAAFLFKEIYIVALVLVPLLIFWVRKPTGRQWLGAGAAALAGVLILSAAIAWIPFNPFPRVKRAVVRNVVQADTQALATNAWSVAYSFRLFAFPDSLNIDHDLPIIDHLSDSKAMLAIGFLAGLGLLLLALRRHLPWSFAAYLAYLILLAPSNSFILRRGDWMIDPISERNLYAPAMFMSVILAEILYRLLKDERSRTIAAICLVAMLGIRTTARTLDFRNDVHLWSASVVHSPNRARPHYNLAVALKDEGRIEEAIPHAGKAVELSPRAQAYGLLASLYNRADNPVLEEQTLLEGLRRAEEDRYLLHNQLGQLYYRQNKWGKASKQLRQAIRENAGYLQPRFTLVYIFLTEGKLQKAEYLLNTLEKAITRTSAEFRSREIINESYHAMYRFGLGWYRLESGRIDSGIASLKQSVELDPGFVEPYLKLGDYYYRTGNYQASWDWFLRASRLPDHERYSNMIGPYMRNLQKLLENPEMDPGL